MRVISAKQNYNELVAHHLWDEETQIKYFLEYAEEYQLTAYFGDCDHLFRDNPITSVSHL